MKMLSAGFIVVAAVMVVVGRFFRPVDIPMLPLCGLGLCIVGIWGWTVGSKFGQVQANQPNGSVRPVVRPVLSFRVVFAAVYVVALAGALAYMEINKAKSALAGVLVIITTSPWSTMTMMALRPLGANPVLFYLVITASAALNALLAYMLGWICDSAVTSLLQKLRHRRQVVPAR